MKALLTETEAAQRLGCTIWKLQRDRRIGSAIPYVKIGRLVRYETEAVEAYLEKNRFNSTSEYKGGVNG